MKAPTPQNEVQRIKALNDLCLLDTAPEPEFDEITVLASNLCQVPMAAISLVDRDRQWFKSHVGMPVCQTSRDDAFCSHAILRSEALVVPDASLDVRFRDSNLVLSDPQIRFYAGFPLRLSNGATIGTLCVMDSKPRSLDENQRDVLRILATHVTTLIEHRLTKKEREKIENQLDLLVDNAPTMMWLSNGGGECIWVNKALATFWQIERASMMGKVWMDRVHQDDRAACQKTLAEQLALHRPTEMEYRVKQADGSYRWILDRGTPRFDEKGAFVGYIGSCVDVTEFHNTRDALKASKERFQLANEVSEEGIYDVDIPTGQVYSTPRNSGMLGYDVGEIPDTREAWFALVHPDDQERVAGETNDHLQGKTTRLVTNFRQRCKNGQYKWIYMAGKVVSRDENGRPLRMIGSKRDIDEQMAMEQVSSRDREILENTSDFIATCDAEGQVVFLNRAFQRLLGRTANGFNIAEIHPASEYHAMALEMLPTAAREGTWCGELKLQDVRGGTVAASAVMLAHRDQYGVVQHYTIIARDITAQKLSEDKLHAVNTELSASLKAQENMTRELEQAKTAAETASQSKTEFLANMSHEIRTPMTAILGYTEMLDQPIHSESQRREYIDIIRRNGIHLLDLINDVLDLSKIEAGKMLIEREPCDVAKLIVDTSTLMKTRADEKGISLEVEFISAIPRMICSDSLRLKQIILNLLGNAIKFTEKGGVAIRLSYSAPGNLFISVADTGIGMSPEQCGQLFRPFTQADASVTRRFGGTGLGLTISLRLAKLLGGTITATSELNRGSTFTVNVETGPVSENGFITAIPASVKTAGSDSSDRPRRMTGRILVAEDGRDNQRLISMILQSAGATVEVAENGRIAFERAMTGNFDLVLMDMQMPEMDGYTATTLLRDQGCPLPIIALTAHAMEGDRDKCLEVGCTDYMTKPINRDQLLHVVGEHLETRLRELAETTAEAPEPETCPLPPVIRSKFAADADMTDLLNEYVRELPIAVRELCEKLDECDLTKIAQLTHKLKGSGGGYGFPEISRVAALAESSVKSRSSIDSVRREVQSLIDLIRSVDGYNRKLESTKT